MTSWITIERQRLHPKKDCCPDCGKPHTYSPTLKERGMTAAQAHAIFVAPKGNRCCSCYIEHNKKETKALMRRVAAQQASQRVVVSTFRVSLPKMLETADSVFGANIKK